MSHVNDRHIVSTVTIAYAQHLQRVRRRAERVNRTLATVLSDIDAQLREYSETEVPILRQRIAEDHAAIDNADELLVAERELQVQLQGERIEQERANALDSSEVDTELYNDLKQSLAVDTNTTRKVIFAATEDLIGESTSAVHDVISEQVIPESLTLDIAQDEAKPTQTVTEQKSVGYVLTNEFVLHTIPQEISIACQLLTQSAGSDSLKIFGVSEPLLSQRPFPLPPHGVEKDIPVSAAQRILALTSPNCHQYVLKWSNSLSARGRLVQILYQYMSSVCKQKLYISLT